MINLQTNTYKSLIFLSVLTCICFSCLKTFSQEIKNNGIITETVSPLISPLQSNNDNFSNLNNDQDINSFLEKLENSDTKALNFSGLNNPQNSNVKDTDIIIFDKDNISEEINIFDDNFSDQLLQEFSNNNVTFDNISELKVNSDLDTENSGSEFSIVPNVSTSKLEKVKISSLGLEDRKFLPNVVSLWEEISFERAVYLLDKFNYRIKSVVLKGMLNEVLSISQNPPKGESLLEIKFINKKLELIANLNQLETLYKLIDLLPDDKSFDHWRVLRVEHLLLKGEFEADNFACRIVKEISVKNEDEFWKKAQILCQIILGNEDDAIFDAELLRASGSQDDNFFNLLYTMMGQNENYIVEEDKLELIHIIMMDQIRNIIPDEFIFKTQKYNYPVLLNIENIQPQTKSFLIDYLVENQNISKTETKFYYDIIGDNFFDASEVFKNLDSNLGPQLRADIWKTLKNYTGEKNLNNHILKLINIEAKKGRPIQAVKLFSEFLIVPDEKTDPNYLAIKDIKLINSIYSNFIDSFDGVEIDSEKSFFSNLLSLLPNDEIKIDLLLNYSIEESIPILKLFNVDIKEDDYLGLFPKKNQNFDSIENNILLKLALNKASKENNLVEALTITSLLINDLNISLLSSNTVFEIVNSLNSFGLIEISRSFAREWLVSKIITNISGKHND